MQDHNGMDHWREEGCTTEDGTLFRGWSLYFRYSHEDGQSVPQNGTWFLDVGWVSGQAIIVAENLLCFQ